MKETDIKFLEPFESDAVSYLRLKPDGNGSIVTWAFESEMPYPMNLFMVVYTIEEMMEKDWTKGLKNLEKLCVE